MRTSVTARRLLAGVGVPLLLSTMVACGGADEPVDQSADANEPVASETPQQAEGSPEPDESEETKDSKDSEQAEAPDSTGDELTTKTFIPALKEALKDNQSAHMSMDLDAAGQQLSIDGDIRYQGDPAMTLTMQGAAFGGGSAQMRLVDGLVYASLPPMTPRGKFVEIDPSDPNDPLGGSFSQLTQQMNPETTFAAFEAGLKQVRYVGEESVAGEELDRYRVGIDVASAARAQGQPFPPGAPEVIDYDIWVDGEDLMRRVDFDLGQQVSSKITMSQWGEPVEVEAPPRNKIVKAPQGVPAPG